MIDYVYDAWCSQEPGQWFTCSQLVWDKVTRLDSRPSDIWIQPVSAWNSISEWISSRPTHHQLSTWSLYLKSWTNRSYTKRGVISCMDGTECIRHCWMEFSRLSSKGEETRVEQSHRGMVSRSTTYRFYLAENSVSVAWRHCPNVMISEKK